MAASDSGWLLFVAQKNSYAAPYAILTVAAVTACAPAVVAAAITTCFTAFTASDANDIGAGSARQTLPGCIITMHELSACSNFKNSLPGAPQQPQQQIWRWDGGSGGSGGHAGGIDVE
jgi:hypothetical protein